MGRNGRTERTICLGLIKLNNVLPAEIGLFWLTPKEIHERLIYGGVDRSLKLSSVDKAIKNYNKGEEHLKKSEYGGKSYFRSTLVHLNDAHNQFCHTERDCKMPLGDKQSRAELVDFDLGLIKRFKQYGIKPRKRRKPLGLFDPSKL